jgi:hypothetical protein
MPRVHFVKKARKAHGNGVEKGDSYYWWEFRYGGKRVSKTYPKRSQLTQSRKSEVYGELESAEEMDAVYDNREDLSSAIQQAAETAREIGQEMESNAEGYFGGGGPQAELAQGYEEWADQLEDLASQIEDLTVEDSLDEYNDELSGLVSEAVGTDLPY